MPSSDLDKDSSTSAAVAADSVPAEKVEAHAVDGPSDESPRKNASVSKRDIDGSEGSAGTDEDEEEGEIEDSAPPLPDEAPPPLPSGEAPPPLPDEAPPVGAERDDGWAPVWDDNAQGFYFYNRFTGQSQWENPRVPEGPQPSTTLPSAPGTELAASKPQRLVGGYDPAIHGDYDPNADYAKAYEEARGGGVASGPGQPGDAAQTYAATGAFNRFTGKWQAATLTPDNYNDDAKSNRQMNAFFDVDAAANSHDGRSLKAERSNKKLSKKEVKAFREKRREKKEEKRRAWLRD